jgi:thiamine-phosphate pyrophosphorylase
MSFSLPRIYPILDSSLIPGTGREAYLDRLGRSLADAGVTLLEYRNKVGTDAEVLADARVLRAAMPAGQVRLVMDDRVDVALASGFDGVHVDGGDLPPADVRRLMGLMGLTGIVGTSASDEGQLTAALIEPVDYIAFGPVFPTTTKQTSAPPVGIEGVRRFRSLAGPDAALVAAAGITLETAAAILDAGANSVAVAAAIFRAKDAEWDPAGEFRRWIRVLG